MHTGSIARSTYRLDELGWLQFEQLCDELLAAHGLEELDWDGRADMGRLAAVEALPPALTGARDVRPGLILSLWIRGGDRSTADAVMAGQRLTNVVRQTGLEGGWTLVVTNAGQEHEHSFAQGVHLAGRRWDGESAWIGSERIAELLDALPLVRRRVPAVLGVRDLDPLLDDDVRGRSSWDEAAARDLARMFVPTRAYRHSLDTLERHRFAVLTGPPEMGKTAIAQTIGLALATEGWQVHECIRPDQVWAAFDPDRPQLFVADDAFGSTEYRPDAADRWALELDRILRRLDDRHWLAWTSRPAPLKAGLGRIHREHGVERFPQPAQVQVDASSLDIEEQALILFRHARAADLRPAAIEIVREYGETIVEHAHFTPGRIGRFVQTRLPQLAAGAPGTSLQAAIDAEIAEPTTAMAASLRALAPEHRALLVAMVDQPPGPVTERELAATARRHAPEGLPRKPAELVDRLTDHFVRVIPPATVTWVHPSWRDLVIDDLAADAAARMRFLRRCSLDGLLLALSHGGGATGRRALPLLVDDADWDAAGERIHELVPELDAADVTRLLANLEAALGVAGSREADELLALTTHALERLSGCWRSGTALPEASLLEKWLDIAARLPEPPTALDGVRLGAIWQQTAPADRQLETAHEAEQYTRWLRIAELLEQRSPGALASYDFPRGSESHLNRLFDASYDNDLVHSSDAVRSALAEALALVEKLVPAHAALAAMRRGSILAHGSRPRRVARFDEDPWAWAPPPLARSIVRRILADLG